MRELRNNKDVLNLEEGRQKVEEPKSGDKGSEGTRA